MPSRIPHALAALGVIAYLWMGFAGIYYGLPHAGRPLTYNCDETHNIELLSKMRPPQNQWNPYPEYGHPTFYLLLYGANLFAASKVGYLPNVSRDELQKHPEKIARFFLVGRYLQIVFGLLLLAALWGVTSFLFGSLVAGLCVFFMAITPGFVAASHFTQINIPVTTLAFFALGGLLIAERRGFDQRWASAAAFFTGLAFSSKYSALPILGAFAVYAWVTPQRGRFLWKTALWIAVGFFLGTPYALITPRLFLKGFEHHAHDNVVAEVIPSLWTSLLFPARKAFPYCLGTGLWIASLGALGWAIARYRNAAWAMIGVWFLGFYVCAAGVGYIATPARVLIVAPLLVLSLAVALDHLRTRGPLGRLAFGLAVCGLVVSTALPSLAIVRLRRLPPLQQISSEWIRQTIPTQRSIGLLRDIFWWSPDVVYESAHHPERMTSPYKVINLHFSLEEAKKQLPDYLVISDRERYRCSAWNPPQACQDLFEWLDNGSAYRVVQRFPRSVGLRSWIWHRPERPFETDDDLWATSLTVYERRP